MSTDPRIEAAAKALGERIDMHLPSAFDDGCLAHDGSHCEDDGDCIQDMARAALAAADKAATITTREQFEALPRGTVVRDYIGQVAERQEDFWANTLSGRDRAAVISFPARVIHWGTE